jgi:hypothetical protein
VELSDSSLNPRLRAGNRFLGTDRASSRNLLPATVKLSALALRSNSRIEISSSRSRICRLIAG